MVSGTISLPCSGFFSPFLHSTRSLSVSREYLALPDGPGRFAQDSSCPALLRIPLCCISLHILDYHRLWSHFPKCSVHDLHTMSRSYNPSHALRRHWFGLFPVRSPLLGESLLFSSPAGNEMFQFPAFACMIMHDRHLDGRVAPFGNPRVKGYLHLAVDYRGLSRPSSPPRA